MLLLPFTLSAQKEVYVYSQLEKNDGLASNQVFTVLQDKKRYIWLGTSNGLQRYDGLRFTTFLHNPVNPASLHDNRVLKLLEDKAGQLWAATTLGVTVLDPSRTVMRRIPVIRNNINFGMEVLDFFQDRNGLIWLTTRRTGIFVYDQQTDQFRNFFHALPSLPRLSPMKVKENPSEPQLWIGTDSGIVIYDQQKKKYLSTTEVFTRYPFLKNSKLQEYILDLFFDANNRIWITVWCKTDDTQKTFLADLKTGMAKQLPPITIEQPVIFQDSGKRIWSVGNSFYRYNESSSAFEAVVTDSRYKYGIDYDQIYTMYEDEQHTFWLTTNNGVFTFRPDARRSGTIIIRPDNNGNTGLDVTSFCELQNGDIWFSSWGSGIFRLSSRFQLKNNFVPEGGNYKLCWSIAADSSGTIWVGCQSGHVMTFNANGKLLSKLHPDVFNNRTIRCITVTSKGIIWFGTQHGLLIRYDPQTKKYSRLPEKNSFSEKSGNIQKIVEDKKGRLWICTSTYGILEIDPETGVLKRRFSSEEPVRKTLSYGFDDLLAFNDTTLIAASATGMELINPETDRIRSIQMAEGLPSNSIVNLRQEDATHLFFSTNNQIGSLDLISMKTIMYGAKDGILEDSYEQPASIRLKNNTVLIGGNRNIVFLFPNGKEKLPPLPDVTITGFKIFDHSYNIDSLLRKNIINLSHRQNFFTVEFASLSYLDKEKVVYYYQLEGVDKNWIRAGDTRFANYTNLNGGKYLFKVKAERSDGTASTNVTAIPLHIDMPFWKQWWFYLLIALSAAGIVYIVQRIRIQRILAMEKVRKRIARDLHDDMGSTLSTINILSEMAKMKIDKDQQKTTELIEKISANSSRMMESMDDIVWSINPVNDSMQNILARMREFATTVFEPKDIAFTFRIEEQVKHVRLDLESRHDFFMIFKEAINNIAKYAESTTVLTEVLLHKSHLILRIADNGQGFDVNNTDAGNGLDNMRKRAEELKGTLAILSTPKQGTTITLEFPYS